jgi:hypothetical protein
MARFAITGAAAQEIRSRLESSSCERPTASLLDSSQTFTTPSEMVDAISRQASDSEMLELVMKEYRKRQQTLEFCLTVGVYEAAKCRPQDLVMLEGIQFAMPKEMLEYLRDYVLDYADGRFLLRSGSRVVARLMDLEGGSSAV